MIFIPIEPKDANAKYEKTKLTRFSFNKAYQNLYELNCRASADRVIFPCIYGLTSCRNIYQDEESPKFIVSMLYYYKIPVVNLAVGEYRKVHLQVTKQTILADLLDHR